MDKLQQSLSGDSDSKTCLEAAMEKKQTDLSDDEVGLKALSSAVSPERSDGSKDLHMDDDDNGESENPSVKEDVPAESFTENDNNASDLLSFIRFHKVPTRTRSSMAIRGRRVSNADDENTNESHNSGESRVVSADKGQESEPVPEAPSEQLDHEYECEEEQVEHRGEKRPLCVVDTGEGAKKPRDQQSSNDDGYAERIHQPLPDSFKICDLNLTGTCKGNDNHDVEEVSNSSKISDKHNSRRSDEVIDLVEEEEEEEEKKGSEGMDDQATIFTDLESFPDSMQRVNEMAPDGYGLMISELLEADIPGANDQIGIQNDEGILDDDESIYMSLGEIPISFVPVWDQQPTRGYDKPY